MKTLKKIWEAITSPFISLAVMIDESKRINEDGSWDRDFEEHRERAWTEEQLRAYLADAGFGKVTLTGDLTARAPKPEEDRWIFRVEKTL